MDSDITTRTLATAQMSAAEVHQQRSITRRFADQEALTIVLLLN